jgi:hypothetical protein
LGDDGSAEAAVSTATGLVLRVSGGGQCTKPNKPYPAYRRSNNAMSDIIKTLPPIFISTALKTTRHRGKFPEASRHSGHIAPVHGAFGSRTSRLQTSMQENCLVSNGRKLQRAEHAAFS